MNADNHVHGGNVYAWARERGRTLTGVLDYSANINPLGLSERVREAITQSVEQVIHYPDVEAALLKTAISSYYQVDTAHITAGNGAVELLYVLAHSLRPKRVLIPVPAFCEYERAARAAGAHIEYAYLSPENNFHLDVNWLCERLHGVDMVFIGNPSNPTGTLLTVSQLERLLFAAKQTKVIVVVDESFMDFIIADEDHTCRPLLKKYDNLVILHSLTKFYAMPGLRLGFALTNPDLTARLHLAKDPWNVNCLAQTAGVAALNDVDYRQQSRGLLSVEKDLFYRQLAELPGLNVYPPSVNFILIGTTGTGVTAAVLREALLEHKLLIRDCSNYPGLSPYFIRVAVKQPEQNRRLIRSLQTILAAETKR